MFWMRRCGELPASSAESFGSDATAASSASISAWLSVSWLMRRGPASARAGVPAAHAGGPRPLEQACVRRRARAVDRAHDLLRDLRLADRTADVPLAAAARRPLCPGRHD